MRSEPRIYRNAVYSRKLVHFQVAVKETDLMVSADRHLGPAVRELILRHRGYIEAYIDRYPEFQKTLAPCRIPGPAPAIVREMAMAGEKAGVGPMAAVAGAVAEAVGNDLLQLSEEVIVENGGDIFFKTRAPVTVGIYAGNSPLSLKIGLKVDSARGPVALCTSSGTVGHSLSFGKADAVCVMSDSCALADAAATAVGNRVRTAADISGAIHFGKAVSGVSGLVVVIGKDMGFWGNLDVIPLQGKKY